MWKKPIHLLRILGVFDGISLLILIGIAMPLKYFAGYPIAVTIVGAIHGVIFISYALSILNVTIRIRWNFIWSIIAFAVAFIPFGNFIFDLKLKKLEEKYSTQFNL